MTLEMWYALGILALAIILFVTEWLRVDVVAIGVILALMLTGLLSPSEAIAGFSNSAVITIAALFIVGGAVLHTGLAGMIGRRILRIAGTDEKRLTLVVMLAVASLSGFMSDTGTVAVLLPAIVGLAKSAKLSPSKLLIPLSFGSLLGGAMTLIGTPPNIIVSDLMRENGFAPFQFFSYTPIGVLLLGSGVLFMLVVGRHMLPDNKPVQDIQRADTSKDLINLYHLGNNLYRLRLRRRSPLIGKTIAEANLRGDFNVTIVEILREPEPRSVARIGEQRLVLQTDNRTTLFPRPDLELNDQDILLVRGESDDVQHAAAQWNLGIQPANPDDEHSIVNQEIGIAEVLLPPRSDLINKTLMETRFGPSYNLTVLGIDRPSATEPITNLRETPLLFGDTLLVQGAWTDIMELRKRQRDFVVIGQPEDITGNGSTKKAPVAMIIMAFMLFMMVTNIVPLVTASLLAALGMILTRCLTMDEAYDVIDWRSIVLIAGMLPMATALEKVGLVDLISRGVTEGLGASEPLIILGGLFLLTSFFTQVLSNTATTVLIAPIALATASELSIQPHAFMMAVAIAASMAFASPVASPVNTLVLGSGDYRFADYIKIGVPMIFIMLIVTVVALPIFWPFTPVP